MTQKYADRYGFREICEWQLETYAAKCSDIHLDRVPTDNSLILANIRDVGWEKIHAYDATFAGGVYRNAYLKAFMEQRDSFNKVRRKGKAGSRGTGIASVVGRFSLWNRESESVLI